MARKNLFIDESLAQRLPLPLSLLYLKAVDARSPIVLHQSAYYLWEAALKLQAITAIACLDQFTVDDDKLTAIVKKLSAPGIGDWWNIVKTLLPPLAESKIEGFSDAHNFLLNPSGRSDLKRVVKLFANLESWNSGQEKTPSKVVLSALFDRLTNYRNVVIGHGAVGLSADDFYLTQGQVLLEGIGELLVYWHPLCGRTLVHVVEFKRRDSGGWIVEWDNLTGPRPRSREPLQLTLADATNVGANELPVNRTLYVVSSRQSPLLDDMKPLRPLAIFLDDVNDVALLNAAEIGEWSQAHYLAYSSSRQDKRKELADEQRLFLSHVARRPIAQGEFNHWVADSLANQSPVPSVAAEVLTPKPIERSHTEGKRIGGYEVISELGRGGMGIVYRAIQPGVNRQVALKQLMKVGDSKTKGRFEQEIKALGKVRHPNLAQVFASGVDGEQSFFTMELVEGAPLSTICQHLKAISTNPGTLSADTWTSTVSSACMAARASEKPVTAVAVGTVVSDPPMIEAETSPKRPVGSGRPLEYVRQIVELIRQVAMAADALHQAKPTIIHRDIKPGNIMVTSDGKTAVLVDLGVAQMAEDDKDWKTATREPIGTVRYASPEQLNTDKLTATADVYSLGATLWELLTLKPFLEINDNRPSAANYTKIQTQLPKSVRQFNPAVPHVLDVIIQKCVAKTAGDRYPSAKALADDLHRWLNGEPVALSGFYFKRWWHKSQNIVGRTIVPLIIVCLIAGIVKLALFPINNSKPTDASNIGTSPINDRDLVEIARSQSEIERLIGEKRLPEARLRSDELLTVAGNQLTTSHPLFGQCLELRATIHNLEGETDQAAVAYRKASAIYEKCSDKDNLPQCLIALGTTFMETGNYGEAEQNYRRSLQICEESFGSGHLKTAVVFDHLGELHRRQSDFPSAISFFKKAFDIRKDRLGPDGVDTANNLNSLSKVYIEQGNFAAALPLAQQALDIQVKVSGEDHPFTISTRETVGECLRRIGEREKAKWQYDAALTAVKRKFGEENLHYAKLIAESGEIAFESQNYSSAIEAFKRAIETYKRLQTGRTEIPKLLMRLGAAARQIGPETYRDAETNFQQAMESYRTEDKQHPDYATLLFEFGLLRESQENVGNAESLYLQALAIREKALEPDHPDLIASLNKLALFKWKANHHADARSYITRAIQGYRKHLDNTASIQSFDQQIRYARISQETLSLFLTMTKGTPPEETWDIILGWKGLIGSRRQAKGRTTTGRDISEVFRKERTSTALVDYRIYRNYDADDRSTSECLTAFVCLKNGIHRVELGDTEPIIELIRSQNWRDNTHEDAAKKLRELLWSSIESLVQNMETVLVSPDGGLAELPWGAIPGSDHKRFLIEDHAVSMILVPSMIPSFSVRSAFSDGCSALLVGDVDYSGPLKVPTETRGLEVNLSWRPEFQGIPGTGMEIDLIRNRLISASPNCLLTILRGVGAKKADFINLAPKHDWVHLATHGYVVSRVGTVNVQKLEFKDYNTLRVGGGLVFAGANQHDIDSILSFDEVRALDLSQVDTVVLAACDTVSGKFVIGEGLLSVQNAFHYAGAKTVVAGLQEIPDAPTVRLMDRFYGNLLRKKEKLGKLAALREAQIWMLRDPEARRVIRKELEMKSSTAVADATSPENVDTPLPPYYWAGFILSGDWR